MPSLQSFHRSPPTLQVSNLTIRRGDTIILDAINWSVARGQNWVILGANGSGKTSLLRALAGYLSPTEGEIHVLGETFGECDWRKLREHTGIISSSISQMMADDDTVLNIVIGGKYAMMGYWGQTHRQDKFHAMALLEEMNLAYAFKRPWYYLSQGERQRALIARALMANPKLLILDEPCSGLDPIAREDFLIFVDQVQQRSESIPIILVTHHIEEIVPSISHAMLLKHGKVVAQGPIKKNLTSQTLSETFSASLRVRRNGTRLQLIFDRSRVFQPKLKVSHTEFVT